MENTQDNQELTSHEKKELKKQQKEEHKKDYEKSESDKKQRKSTVKYFVIGVVILLVILGGYYFIIKPIKDFKPFHSDSYHWHANFDISVCGVPASIRCPGSMCGPMNLHHHNDDIIHIEGSFIANEDDLAIGKFLDGIGVKFSGTEILNMKNGDLCPDGKAGSVKMFVNGVQNNKFEKYIPSRCDSENIKEDCEKIEIKFD